MPDDELELVVAVSLSGQVKSLSRRSNPCKNGKQVAEQDFKERIKSLPVEIVMSVSANGIKDTNSFHPEPISY